MQHLTGFPAEYRGWGSAFAQRAGAEVNQTRTSWVYQPAPVLGVRESRENVSS